MITNKEIIRAIDNRDIPIFRGKIGDFIPVEDLLNSKCKGYVYEYLLKEPKEEEEGCLFKKKIYRLVKENVPVKTFANTDFIRFDGLLSFWTQLPYIVYHEDLNTKIYEEMDVRDLMRRAVKFNTVDVLRYLLDFGVHVDQYLDMSRKTTLHYAAKEGRLNMVNFLLERGADKNIKDENELKAIDYASYEKQEELMKIFNKKRKSN